MIGVLLLMFGPALLFLIVAIILLTQKEHKKAKMFFVLTGVYLLISLGICGIMLANFTLDTK